MTAREYDLELLRDIADQPDIDTLAREATRTATRALAERLEYELRGAWRAGYDYLHVYDDHGEPTPTASEYFTVRQYVLPSTRAEPPMPSDRRYLYTYDIGSVPDDEIRAAIREGET